VAPPAATLIVMYTPDLHGVIRIARVVICGEDLDAVAIGIAHVEIKSVRYAMTPRAAFNSLRLAQRAEVVTYVQNLMALLDIEGKVMQTWPIALRKRYIVHRWFAIHPGRERRSQFITNLLGDLEVEIQKILPCGGNIRRQDIEVVKTQKRRRTESIVSLRVPFNVFGLAEKLQRETQGILHVNKFAETSGRTFGAPLHAHAQFPEIPLCCIQIPGRTHPVRYSSNCRRGTFPQDQRMVQILLESAKMDFFRVLKGYQQAKAIRW